MAESTKTTETNTTAKKDTKPSDTSEPVTTPPKSGAKRKASESSDPAVQQLLAEHQTHTLNGNTEAVNDVEARLNKMGFTL